MDFTFEFIRVFALGLFYAAPLILLLMGMIIFLGVLVGKKEGWSISDSIYYAFITATTVGYGDYRPNKKAAKFLAIGIAFVGLLMTGIVVAIGLEAATFAFKEVHSVPILEVAK